MTIILEGNKEEGSGRRIPSTSALSRAMRFFTSFHFFDIALPTIVGCLPRETGAAVFSCDVESAKRGSRMDSKVYRSTRTKREAIGE